MIFKAKEVSSLERRRVGPHKPNLTSSPSIIAVLVLEVAEEMHLDLVS